MTDSFQVATKKYYHGSGTEILGGVVQPNVAFNSVQDRTCRAAFVTSDKDQAEFFAINHCISGNGHIRQDGKRVYLERLSPNIKNQFYVYTVSETKENPFIHDQGTEYYATKPIQIAEAEKFGTLNEIRRLGYEIYVLNEPLKNKMNKTLDNNFDVQAEMTKAIKEKKYHPVNIEEEMRRQSRNVFGRMLGRILQNS